MSNVKRKMLQLIAAGIISLILSFDDFAVPFSTERPSDNSCSDFVVFGGFGYNETVDPDMRYPIPVIKSTHPDPTDSVVVHTARCLQQLMEQEMWNEVEFNGQYMDEIDVQEMLNW